MSIFISFESQTKPVGDQLELAIKKIANEMDFDYHAYSSEQYGISLCPEGQFYIFCKGNEIRGEIQTNVAGPGFHKGCIEFLEKLGPELDIEFEIDDETGYNLHKDFQKLKLYMLGWLTTIFSQLMQKNGSRVYDQLVLCWDIREYKPIGIQYIVTPCGYFDPEFINSCLRNNQIDRLAELFWVWCNEGKDAFYYRQCALALMWKEVVWRKPTTDYDERILKDAIQCLEKSSQQSTDISLPVKEWKEMCELVGIEYQSILNPELIFPTAIGYRRNDIRFNLPMGYSLQMPGSFRFQYESDLSQVAYDGDRLVRIMEEKIKPINGIDPREGIQYPDVKLVVNHGKLDFSNSDHRYMAIYGTSKNTNGDFSVLCGEILGTDNKANVIIFWDVNADEEWAVETFRSIGSGGLN